MTENQMRRLYLTGATMRDVAAAAGCSLTKTHGILADIARPVGRPRKEAA